MTTIPQNTPQSNQPHQKQCRECKRWLPLSQFTVARRNKDGLRFDCNDCKLEYQRTYRRSNSERNKKYKLRSQYGITTQQYKRMLAEQGDVCAVCNMPETHIDRRSGNIRELCVDHDHKTGEVRALLCSACNVALGRLNEDPARIRALADYAEWCRNHKPSQKIVQLKLID